MSTSDLISFLPELVLLAGAAVLFVISLGRRQGGAARAATLATALAFVVASAAALGRSGLILDGAYRVDAFSQVLKLVLGVVFLLVVLAGGRLPDIHEDVKPEYFLLLALSMTGLVLLVSCVEVITLVIALELSSFPLFLMVPMRREQAGYRSQMEAAAKYIMFSVAATGLMFFGLSYLFGLTGTLHLVELLPRLQPLWHEPLAVAGLALTFCGIYFKMAVFPFHAWSPDVYEASATETTTAIASLPKIGAVVVLTRFVALAGPDHALVATMLTAVAIASMLYGNLIALAQQDVKRLLGFSAIAHAGYALVGMVAMDTAGFAATLYYMIGYAVMVIACFAVLRLVGGEGTGVAIGDLAGLHRRSPLLAATLAVGIFGLAGLPPLAGFMGKLMLLKAALAQGHLALVIAAVVNAALAIYYYLQIVREAYFKEAGDRPPVSVPPTARLLCWATMGLTLALGLFPAFLLDRLCVSLAATLAAAP